MSDENAAAGEAGLPRTGIIGGLDDETRAALEARGRFETFKAGHAVITQGDPHEGFWVLLDGKLRVSVHAHGDTVVLDEVKPGEVIGEMSVIDPHTASASVTVVDRPARLWTIEAEAFRQFAKEDPAKGYAVLMVLAKELCHRLRHNSDSMLRREETMRDHYRDMDY